jgi:hypothetical protein
MVKLYYYGTQIKIAATMQETAYIKGSPKRKRGIKKLANDRNWPQTAAIEVCLPYNFAVVFDFMYFPFHPSKAK